MVTMMESVWQKTAAMPCFDRLNGDIETDVLVIGGGMAGILCAHMLKESGVDCILTEADRVCGGVTQNTTAKITSQHGLIYDKLIHEFGVKKARQYLLANEEALRKYRELCGKIDCDFESKANFVYSLNRRDKIRKELEALAKIGFPARYAETLPLPISVAGAVAFPDQAQFHPLKFCSY